MLKIRVDLNKFFGKGHFWAQFPNTKASDHHNSVIEYLESQMGACIDSGGTEAWFLHCDPKTLIIKARIEVSYAEFKKTGAIDAISLLTTGKMEYNKEYETPVYVIEDVEIE